MHMKRLLLLFAALAMLVMTANAEYFNVGKLKFWACDDGVSVFLSGVSSGTVSGDLIIPSTVNYEDKDYKVIGISNGAFRSNTGLTSVTIPNTVTTIYGNAFSGCTSLREIYFPKTLEYLGASAFYKTPWLDAQPNGVVYASTALYTYKGTMPQNTSIVIQDGTTCIAESAFSKCTNLNSVQIPNTVKTICTSAFNSCSALANVNIPSSVKLVGDNVFNRCSSLPSITLPNTLPYISYGMFAGCTSLTSITIPNSVKFIGQSSFHQCTGLTSVSIPNTVTAIGYGAFYECTNLAEISVPSTVRFIGAEAFSKTAWYNSQPDGVVYTGTIALKYKGEMPSGTLLTIKDGTTAIADNAFQNCTGITVLRLPNSLNYIGNGAFTGCSTLTVLTIPGNVKSIGASAFNDCTNLTEIAFPNSLLSIGQSAFYNTAWFNYQPDGVVYAGPVAIKYKGSVPEDKTLTIKEGTKGVAENAFYQYSGFQKVVLPNTLTRIGYYAFNGMSSLLEVNIPESVTTIGTGAFAGAARLQRVDAYVDPSRVTMGEDALSLRLPNYYFYDRLTYSVVFTNYVDDRELHVLPGKEESFRNSLCWALFKNIVGDLGGSTTGDLNGDGQVNTGDVSELYRAILNGLIDSKYDINGDGSVNTGDVSALYSILLGN